VFGEIAKRHLATTKLQTVFPGHTISEKNFRGFLSDK